MTVITNAVRECGHLHVPIALARHRMAVEVPEWIHQV
jgi:hypothetical protein